MGWGTMRGGKFAFTSRPGDWGAADWLCVTDSPWACFVTNIPRERRILFLTEPPGITDYPKYAYYLEQFGVVVSPYDIPGYSGRLEIGNPCLGWFAGRSRFRSISDVLSYQAPKKTKMLSTVTSLKKRLPWRKQRVALMQAARRKFGGLLDWFGREFAPVNDKLDAIAPYKYHIAVENSKVRNYWTEKLTDAWIGWALPIYCGDPSILEQIPDPHGIELIDVDDIPGTLKRIQQILETDPYESRIDAIKKCREWAIRMANPYERVCKIVESADADALTLPKLKRPELLRILIKGRKGAVYRALRATLGIGVADKVLLAWCESKGALQS